MKTFRTFSEFEKYYFPKLIAKRELEAITDPKEIGKVMARRALGVKID